MPIPIFTFVNDDTVYAEMLGSFREAGFTASAVTFVQLRSGEDPYSTITKLISEVEEPHFILCHQDLRADRGHGFEDLNRAIETLERHDPHWAVAGNAGGMRNLNVVRCVTDPTGGRTRHRLPARVHSLDENFLVLKSRTGVRCSTELSGFHFYGPDVCLNALALGRTAYVIDFHLTHLSAGRRDEVYYAARARFIAHWSRRFHASFVRTTIEVIFLSRWRLLRPFLGHPRLCKVLKNHFVAARMFGAVFGRRSRSRVPAPRRHAPTIADNGAC